MMSQWRHFAGGLSNTKAEYYYLPTSDWTKINFNIISTTGHSKFAVNSSDRLKLGMNVLSNRFWFLNGKIDMNWFNLSFESFKNKC